jgi:hypothetical protein
MRLQPPIAGHTMADAVVQQWTPAAKAEAHQGSIKHQDLSMWNETTS